MRIDSHQHFWSYDEKQYPWIPKGSPLHRDWLPADLAALQKPLGIEGAIAVQARQTLDESRWLLQLAAEHTLIKGVVGWADLRAGNVEDQLAEFARNPKFRGVRHVVQDEPDDRFLTREDVVRGISKLHQFGFTYDLLVHPRQLAAAIELVRHFPHQRFVLDHIAKPRIRDRVMSPWKDQLQELSKSGNVYCKVSGLITEADHKAWIADDFRPYLDVVFNAFGTTRLMWGSDWPVCLLAGSYEQTYRLIENYTAGLSAEEKAAVFGGNTARFYNCVG
jgi:L-fuconolactonase